MSITLDDKFSGQRMNGGPNKEEYEFTYILRGSNATTDTLAAAKATLEADAPQTFAGFSRLAFSVEETEAPLVWLGTMRFGTADGGQQETGNTVFSFDTTGGTQHITQSRRTMTSYGDPLSIADESEIPDFGGAIGVTEDDVTGCDISTPQFAFQLTRYVDAAEVTEAYINTLYSATGTFNDASWTFVTTDGRTLTLPAGEALFDGARGSARQKGDYEIVFNFRASKNITAEDDIHIGEIGPIEKLGWDYLWVQYERKVGGEAGGKTFIMYPKFVVIDRVYDPSDFADLNIPAV